MVGSTTLIAGDAAIKSRLETLGFSVTLKDAPSSATTDATGKALVLISESVTATDVGIKFRDVAVPVMVMEAGLYDDMLMTGLTVGTDYDNASGQSQVVIANPAHPMAAGLAGTVTVTSSATAFAWGRPGADAAKVVSLATDATKYALFGYESGSLLVNGTSAPARRVGMFLWKDTPTFLNASGWTLFDAAVRWETAPQVLFVVGSTTLVASDAAVKSRLNSLGFSVTVKDASSSATADATGKALVVISESVTSTNVGTKFRDVTVPVIVMEAALFDDMMMTGPTVGTDYDNVAGQTQVVITNSSHPMAASLTGTVTVTTTAKSFAWGKPGAAAVKVGALTIDTSRYALFGYESGAAMVGMNAPARRAGVFLCADTATFLNESGWALFDAAVYWNISITPPVAYAGGPYYATVATGLQFDGSASYDPDGTIASYIWDFGDGQIGTGVSPSHAYASSGSYTVTLTVTDNSGAVSRATTSVTVVPPPPAAPSALTATATSANQVNLAWADNSSNETGFKIERKTGAGGTYAEITTVGAGVMSYSNTGLMSNTQYFYRVRATNTGGDSAYSNEAGATTQNQPPTVSLTAPAIGSSYTAPTSITLTATAADADSGVAKVEFYQGTTKLGEDLTSPYSYVWSNVPAGSYSLTAKAIDVNGAQATSAAAAVTVTLPTVTVSATDANASEQGPDAGAFTISRTGTTGAALTVNYTVGGIATSGADYASVGTSVTIPAGASSQVVTVTPIDDAVVENGGETLVLTLSNNAAYTVGSPSSATVTIADNDTYPPSASITSPAGGTVFTVPASIGINATAADADGSVVKVEFFQGATKLAEDTTAPYSFAWVNPAAGSYSLTARATDNAGATGTSAAVSITVNTPPSVNITSPADNSRLSDGSGLTINASASDPDGTVSKVEFYQGATKLGEDTTAPYSFTWANVPEGSYTLTAVATDDRGASTTSTAVRVSIFNLYGALLDVSNRTGGAGVDLVSRNFNWSLPLVSLPGRAGLDLGLSLAYNSLVWTRVGNNMYFDMDGGWPAPGFRLGFPVVQAKFYDSQAQKSAYLLVTPSGARVSLRQTATAGVYEAGDSSYLQLTEETNGSLTVRVTDGTRMSYRPLGAVYRCTEIKDRNGNFITVGYNAGNSVETVTDTLGRVVNFGYNADGSLKEIAQTWHREVEGTAAVTETHQWARFYYTDEPVRTNFAGLNVSGPLNGQTIHALTNVKLSDDSSYTFDYTTWGQVNKVSAYAADGRRLNYVSLDLPADETSAQSDCPRPTERHDWAAYWNGDEDGVGAASEEAVTSYGTYDFAGGVAKATASDGTVHQETYETAGWKRGLVTRADEFSADDHVHPKKWTVLTWTQDDEALTYRQNPRVKETNVYDSKEDGTDDPRDRRRTEVTYTSFGLPQDVKEYDSDASTVLRRTHTEYVPESVNAGGAYAARRIIGLPQTQEVYGPDGGQEKLFSKVTFEYDLANTASTHYLEDAGTVAQHDGSYGASFTTRGNLCRTRRWDAGYPDDQSKSVASEVGYNTLGSVLFTSDALGHKKTISYADSDNGARLAYPTKVTDPDSFYSTVEYNYDIGIVTREVDPKGEATKTFYDSTGRVLKTKNEANDAYAGWEYGASGLYEKRLTKVDTDKTETFVLNVADGAGRVRGTLREMPGSEGGYAAQRFTYDVMGRQAGRSNPMQVSVNVNNMPDIASWQLAGEDAPANGGTDWVYTKQTYDWKGRPRVTTNTDNTTRQLSYGGCGCAGGEVVTLTDEIGRLSKVYSDALGRRWKTEVFRWDGTNHVIYSATTTAYDALDNPVRVRQYAGAALLPEPEGEGQGYQTTKMTYDGHGRLKTEHRPEQMDANNQPLSTTYDYNSDDTVHVITDARGATTTYTYNGRGLVTAVDYGVAQGFTQTWDTAPGVSFGYDEAGGRATMTDGLGSVSYTYGAAGRLSSEKRTFSAFASHEPYELSYEYTLSGALRKLTDPAGDSVTYGYDSAGQLTGVTGSSFAGVTSYASDIEYRAWGGQKSIKYGDTPTSATTTYDARMRPYEYTLSVPATNATPGTSMRERFEYYADGKLKQMTDLDDRSVNFLGEPPADRRFSRRFTYDNAGRIASANGVNASGDDYYLPFRQSYTYDEFDNLTVRSGSYYYEGLTSDIAQYQNNRRQGWTYDNSGNVTHSPIPSTTSGETKARDWTYDSVGRLVKAVDTTTSNGTTTIKTFTSKYDGDGNTVFQQGEQYPGTAYMLCSTVLRGVVVTQLDSAGNKLKTTVSVDGMLSAIQNSPAVTFGTQQSMTWLHRDPAGTSEVSPTTADKKSVYDPAGNYISYQTPPAPPSGYNPFFSSPPSGSLGSGFGFNGGSTNVTCTLDGAPADCNEALHALALGNAAPCPDNNCGAHWNGHAYQFPHFTSDGLFYGGVNPYGSNGNPPTLKRATPEEKSRDHQIAAQFGQNPFGELSSEETGFDFVFASFDRRRAVRLTVCMQLARDAQNQAFRAIKANPNDINKAVDQFDTNFTSMYLAHPIKTKSQAYDMYSRHGNVFGTSHNRGSTGFREEFLDSENGNVSRGNNVDQTHHFAAYFSSGINGQYAATMLHDRQDLWWHNNEGDYNLGVAAYNLGSQLADNPYNLFAIGINIQMTICDVTAKP